MSTPYHWFADEHRRWMLHAFGGAAAATVPKVGTPTTDELADLLWDWLVHEHGERLLVPLLLDEAVGDRVILVLSDLREHTRAETARALQRAPDEVRSRHDALHERLRVPVTIRPNCTHWGEVRGIHRQRRDQEHVSTARRHLEGCATCQRGARNVAAVRRWWLERIGYPAPPRSGGTYTVLSAFGEPDRSAVDQPASA